MWPLFTVLGIAAFVWLIIFSNKKLKEAEKKRVAELVGFCEGKGWRFRDLQNSKAGLSRRYPTPGESGLVPEVLREVSPVKEYWGTSMTGFIEGEIEGIPMMAFETFMVVSTGKTTVIVYLSVMSIQVDTPLGKLALRELGAGGKIAKWFGGQDILCGDEAFDEKYRVTGENVEAAKELFHEGTRILCMREKGVQLAVVGDRVLVWKNVRMDEKFLGESAEFLHRFWDEIPEGWRREEVIRSVEEEVIELKDV